MASQGVCEGCGKPISRERIQALPSARHCFACAVKLPGAEDVAPDEATAEHHLDEATELTIPAFVPDEGDEDEHTQQTDVSKLREE